MNFTRNVSYSCTALMGTNKTGALKPDADGYYTLVLGALDFFNSAGSYYPYESAKHLFQESSSLIRRCNSGALRGEYGHPRKGNMTDAQFLSRIMDIDEKNVCCHIRRVWIDCNTLKDEQGKGIVAILGEVKPMGPYAQALQQSLDNPSENVCFSIRSITNDQIIGGVNNKHLRAICTWDYVNEPGISVANKWRSPALESMEGMPIKRAIASRVAREQKRANIGAENDSTMSMESLIPLLFDEDRSQLPPSARW